MVNKKREWKNPLGQGNSSKKIINILERKIK